MKKKREFKLNVGGSSIILIIVVFALAIFAVLSIKASNSDLVLAKKTRDSVQAYYKADTEAENILMQVDQALEQYETNASDEALKVKLQKLMEKKGTVEAKTDKSGTINYSVKINDYASLEVTIEYELGNLSGKHFDIKKWNVNQSEIGEYSFTDFTFWDGTIEE
ncbi:MAG: hypothetical protein Q4G58_00570 [bacterium]|nr:hypothetical protein [bacterium]